MNIKKLFFILLIMCYLQTMAQRNYIPTAENLEARSTFQDDKLGVLIHWGLYTMLAEGEWVMHYRGMKWHEYEKLAGGFYPSKFDAAQWVSAIKASGAKYITITTHHYEGFSMFNTQYSDYNIVKATPFQRDVLKEIADECQKQDIRLHLFYSLLDWHNGDYYPFGRTGLGTGRKKYGDWRDYLKFVKNQLTELLTNYGYIGAIWLDGMWDKDNYVEGMRPHTWNLYELYELIHKLQPKCLIGNNHRMFPYEGEDFQIFELDLPGQNNYGLAGQAISSLPLETSITMNRSFGYKMSDRNYKSFEQLVHWLVKAAGKNANLLLNVSPQPDGMLPDVAVERLKEIGEWMQTYAPTIQGTRGGVVTSQDWGVTTQRGNTLYVHVINSEDNDLFLPYMGNKLLKAMEFANQKPIKFTQNKEGICLIFPQLSTAPDYVLELTFEKELPDN